MLPMKKVEASCKDNICVGFFLRCGDRCFCYPQIGCVEQIIGENHPNICHSHVECMNKGSGSFCAHSPILNVDYGWCFASKSEAEDLFFKFATKSKFTEDLLKMSGNA